VVKILRRAALALVMAASAGAATNPFGMMNGFSATSAIPVDVKAPTMDFEQGGKKMIASGGVEVTRGTEKLTADTITFDKVTDTALASGNVVFTKSNMVWRGDSFSYNLRDGTWETGVFHARFDPFQVTAREASKTNDCMFLQHAVLTTCTNTSDQYHYSMTCKRMRVYPNDHLVARHMVIRFGGIPMFYLPYWYCALNDRTVGTTVMAGYRGRMGAFLLTSTKYWMTPTLRGITHVDYRTERGPAVGQEVGWISTNGLSKGRVYGYAMDDQGVRKDFDKGNHATLVDSQRYRLSFDHLETLSPRDYVLAAATYLSDPYVLSDFFEREYRYSFQPQNSAMLMHRGDTYSLSLSVYSRLNDFFESVDRLPELAFSVPRVEIGESPFYYESQNSASYLQKSHVAGSGEEDYTSARFDTSHEFYYPTRHFGFLNITPRAGVRETFYSDTVQYSTVTQMVSVLTSNSLAGASNWVVTSSSKTNISTVGKASGSDVRSLVNIGLETSFRAFKLLSNEENMFGTGWRHVVEPYTDYTYVPEPNIRPAQLYQFDEIDALDRRNDLRFGVRNRFQTKKNKDVTDVVSMDVYTTYSFEEADQDKPFSTVGWAGEFHPADRCYIYADGEYDTYASRITTFNTRAVLRQDSWRAGMEHRYRVDESSLLISDLAYAPNKRWEYGLYDRFEFQTSRLEEQGVTVARSFDCMVVTLGGSVLPGYTRDDGSLQDDEYRVTFQLFLAAFPNVKLGSGRRD
jgi:LPS-assembly protein